MVSMGRMIEEQDIIGKLTDKGKRNDKGNSRDLKLKYVECRSDPYGIHFRELKNNATKQQRTP
jgi:hypothetical protein